MTDAMETREFRLPDLGEGLTESDLVTWHVKVGDRVELNEVIAEVETAKALVDIPSPFAGVVAVLHADEGETVEVGEPLVTFEIPGALVGRPDAAAPAAAPTAEPLAEPVDDAAPSGPPVEDDVVEAVAADNLVAEPVETGDARTPAADAPGEDADAPQPNLVGYGALPERAGRPTRRRRRDLGPVPDRPAPGDRLRPAVRAAAAPAEARAEARTEVRTAVRGVRKHTAEAMVASAFSAPQASVFLTVDMTPSMELLTRLKTHPMAGGVRITVLALVARAVCALLPTHQALTGRWVDLDDGSAEIVRPAHVNLGIAVATDRGLVVPHVPAADTLSLTGLADAVGRLTETARAGRTTPERLTGSTLTITNIGVFGVDAGTPILNPGEPAILGVGAVRRRPWEHEGQVALRQVMTLSLTFDHRVVDGEQGARFLAELGAVLADPALGLLLGSAPTTTGEEPA